MILGLVLGLLTVLALYRPILGLLYELRGSAALQAGIQAEGIDQTELACLAPAIQSADAQLLLQQSISSLEQSAAIWPVAHPQLLLGRAYCYTGQASQAVEAYAAYVQARPLNPIGQLELALAFGAACKFNEQPNGTPQFCQDAQIRKTVLHAWKNSGQDPDQFLDIARAAFESGKPIESERYFAYHSAYELNNGGISEADLFLWGVSTILADKAPPQRVLDTLPIFQALRSTRIEGEDLRWLSSIPEWGVDYGDSPQVVTIQDQKAGLVPWNGAVIAIIAVELPGDYRISLQAWDAPPAPILLQVELDGASLGQISFDQGNSSWATHTVTSPLNAGYQIVGIRFLNDEVAGGVDRNLFINWIEIEYVGD